MSRVAVLISSPDQRCPFTDYIDPDKIILNACHQIIEVKRIAQLNRVEILFFASANIELFNLLRADEQLNELPCIVFEELCGNEELTFFKANSDFYLPLDVSLPEFNACLDRVERSLIKIEQLAYRDTLTGCYNRRFFETLLPIEMERARTYQTDLSLALFDIDRFKQINDTYGHVFGDSVLKGFANFLNQYKLSEQTIVRLGGEEFVVVIPEKSIEEATFEMNRLLTEVSLAPIAQKDGIPFHITISGGVALWEKGMTYSELLKQADQWMYKAKRNGRNRIESAGNNKNQNHLNSMSLLVCCHSSENKISYQTLLKNRVQRMYLTDTFTDTFRQLQQEQFDLILIEDSFGKMDLKTIQDIRNTYNTPLLMVFPKKNPDMFDIMNSGVDDCLIQPYEEEDLMYKIEWIGRKKETF